VLKTSETGKTPVGLIGDANRLRPAGQHRERDLLGVAAGSCGARPSLAFISWCSAAPEQPAHGRGCLAFGGAISSRRAVTLPVQSSAAPGEVTSPVQSRAPPVP
jgi:hypothetical protein